VIKVQLDALLAKRQKSRYWLANETSLTQGAIAKLAKNQTTGIDFTTLNAICQALGCKPGDVLTATRDRGKREDQH
jgi:putative transcriptional regulator